MKAFWVTFPGAKLSDLPPGVGPGTGIGVTAIDEKDAIELVEAVLFTDRPIPGEYAVRWLRSLDELEENHVRPNIGFHLRRRVWYPNIPDPQVVDW